MALSKVCVRFHSVKISPPLLPTKPDNQLSELSNTRTMPVIFSTSTFFEYMYCSDARCVSVGLDTVGDQRATNRAGCEALDALGAAALVAAPSPGGVGETGAIWQTADD